MSLRIQRLNWILGISVSSLIIGTATFKVWSRVDQVDDIKRQGNKNSEDIASLEKKFSNVETAVNGFSKALEKVEQREDNRWSELSKTLGSIDGTLRGMSQSLTINQGEIARAKEKAESALAQSDQVKVSVEELRVEQARQQRKEHP